MIDLHSHTNQSDGTFSPGELVQEAVRAGLSALAITDHDTFAGYDQAVEFANRAALALVCGVELSTRYCGRSVHLLAYFLKQPPTREFREWVAGLEASRHRRNEVLIEKLRARDLRITLEEVSARAGRIISRPHFAAVMVEKGYVETVQQAFEEYLNESACCFVSREEPEFSTAGAEILASGGLPVLAHPVRFIENHALLERELPRMQGLGLKGIEVYHSDHSASDIAFYLKIARKLGLVVTGGSDFHGVAKPRIALGCVNVPDSVLQDLGRE